LENGRETDLEMRFEESRELINVKQLHVEGAGNTSEVMLLLNPTETGREWSSIGINYNRMGNNLPSLAESISLMKSLKLGRVKLYESDPEVLTSLVSTGLSVVITVKNEEMSSILPERKKSNARKQAV
ncbi:hypothetical protein KI387_002914, partial [Taxus chinensis]